MEWINYNHLLYFWTVAREGSLVRASNDLRLAQSTVSKQIHLFEDALGQKLFAKSGRRLVLTESGRLVYRFADEIFGLGREMLDTLRDRPVGRPLRVSVGIADVVPKMLVHRVLQPAMRLEGRVHLVCREDKPDRLLADLALHELDVILTDAPAGPHVRVRAFNHLLGESDVTFFATADVAPKYRRNFPRSLQDAPMLLPTENTALRRSVEEWLKFEGLRPNIVGEFEDSALLGAFGQQGAGVFPGASVMAKGIVHQYQVLAIGRVPAIRERLYAITVERRLSHPAVVAICDAARTQIYQDKAGRRPP